jgi:hypothetical protein
VASGSCGVEMDGVGERTKREREEVLPASYSLSGHFPRCMPCLQIIYSPTPTILPMPAPPAILHALKGLALKPAAIATAVPIRLKSSTSICPLFSSNLQLRSCHSISYFPHICPIVDGTIRSDAAIAHLPVVESEAAEKSGDLGDLRIVLYVC